jgi:hypothetical protein
MTAHRSRPRKIGVGCPVARPFKADRGRLLRNVLQILASGLRTAAMMDHAEQPHRSGSTPSHRRFDGIKCADAVFIDIEEKKGRIVAVLGGHGDVEVQAHCRPDGVVSLTAVAISGFRTVRVPRVWDNPERREAERDPRDELGRLARRFKTALDEWTSSVSELATWMRYSPPLAGAKPVEPWFEDQSEEDDDGGPETTH